MSKRASAQLKLRTPTVDTVGLGARVRAQRQSAKLTIKQLADQAEVSFGTIQRIEAGQTNVQLDLLLKVLATLNIDVREHIFGPKHARVESIQELIHRLKVEGRLEELFKTLAVILQKAL
ncbi:MAG: helix-turn-helix domain-containing protein [Candidatus Sumerlaeaceae bacterium]